MTPLSDVALLAADTIRARAYMDLLARAQLYPTHTILLNQVPKSNTTATHVNTDRFDARTPLRDTLRAKQIPYTELSTHDINDISIVQALNALPQNIVIFAGPSGALVRQPLFDTGKKFLHIHPGRLPDYRGSTTMYYSILNEDKLYATALFLDAGIDTGPVIAQKEFPKPDDKREIDLIYDPWMRATLLSEMLQKYAQHGTLTSTAQQHENALTYYIVHPVLKHIAILSRD